MEEKKLFGLIGYPLSHSFSQKYFNEKFEKENIRGCEFNVYPIHSIDLLPELINENSYLKGLSVTLPYKESVIPFLNQLDVSAERVGAVNCIKINNNQLTGYNTDVYGFRQPIKPFLEIQHERALILGTGGASKAVAYVLKEIGIDCYFVTRNKTNQNSGDNKLFSYQELNDNIMNAFKLIVNASPVGMFPDVNNAPEIPYQYLTSSHLLYDLVYKPAKTLFLQKGEARGATTENGYDMLLIQAEASWKIWNNL